MKVLPFPKVRPEEPEASPEVVAPVLAVDGGGTGEHYDRITVRVITVAVAVSIFIHVLLLVLPLMRDTKPLKMPADEIGPLAVRIEPSAPAPAQQKAQPRPEPSPPPPVAPTVQPRPTPAPPRPRLTVPKRTPRVTAPPQIVVPVPAPQPEPQPQARPQPQPQQPPAQDMSDYVAQRRAARGAPTEGREESDDERANRIARANIQAQQRAASPEMVDGGGGLFQLDRTGQTDADFIFRGWSTDFKRNTGLTVHVTRGDNPDIKLAVVRKMIEIIRERKNGDFEWYSYKRGKSITMSARPGDTARLEAFLLHEFYPEDPRGRDAK